MSVYVYRLYTVMIMGTSGLHKLSPRSKKHLAPGYKHVLDEGIALFSEGPLILPLLQYATYFVPI